MVDPRAGPSYRCGVNARRFFDRDAVSRERWRLRRMSLSLLAALMLISASPANATPAPSANRTAEQPDRATTLLATEDNGAATTTNDGPGSQAERRPKSIGQLLKRNLVLFALALGLAGTGLGLVVLMVRRKP